MHRYMEYKDEKSNKFWEITQSAESFTVRYGKIGTDGTEKTKSFADAPAATKEAEKLVKQKEKKGYLTIADDSDASTTESDDGFTLYRYLEFKDEKSNKFWEITQTVESFTVRYGKIGTNGTEKTKSFDDEAAATKEAEKLIKQKEKKGYAAVSSDTETSTSESKETKDVKSDTPKPKTAKTKPQPVAEESDDGLFWVLAEDGYFLALEDGKLVAKNPKGKRLKSVAKKQKETETGIKMIAAKDWLKDHQAKCLETVESWMLRSLPIPTNVLVSVWPDVYWRALIENTIVGPVGDDGEKTGLLRAVDAKKGLGIVNLDGDTIWIKPKQVVIPHPILIEDLNDWRELAADLDVTQGLQQLMRQTYEKPATVEGSSISEFNDAVFEPLARAMQKTWQLGCRVRGGYATATVWENGNRTEACYWIGSEDPAYESYGGELVWTDADQNTLELKDVMPVAWSEGMRMSHAVYGVRKVEEEEEEG